MSWDTVGHDGELDRLPCGRACGFDLGWAADSPRQEEDVPWAPGVHVLSVDAHAVGHRAECESPEAHHVAALVDIHTGMLDEQLTDRSVTGARASREPLALDRPSLCQQPVQLDRDPLLHLIERRRCADQLVGELPPALSYLQLRLLQTSGGSYKRQLILISDSTVIVSERECDPVQRAVPAPGRSGRSGSARQVLPRSR